MEHTKPSEARIWARDKALAMLNRLTAGVAFAAVAGVGIFGGEHGDGVVQLDHLELRQHLVELAAAVIRHCELLVELGRGRLRRLRLLAPVS